MSTIMVRVSSTESYDDHNLLIQDFKHLTKNEEVAFKTQPNQNIRNQQKYKLRILLFVLKLYKLFRL